MKSRAIVLVFATMLGSAGLIAAEQSGEAAKAARAAKGRTVTVTGCLAESTGGTYALTPAGSKERRTQMSGKSASYTLVGPNIKAHVGQKVRVTGTVTSDNHESTKLGKVDSDNTGKSGMGGSTITVRSVKTIAASCR